MSDHANDTSPSFITRLLSNDSAQKGAAAAIAGVLVAFIQEALWPSK
jgi:hypothetical protein